MLHLAPNAIIIKEIRESETCSYFLNIQFKSKSHEFQNNLALN